MLNINEMNELNETNKVNGTAGSASLKGRQAGRGAGGQVKSGTHLALERGPPPGPLLRLELLVFHLPKKYTRDMIN